MFFTEDDYWNAERQAVEFWVDIGNGRGGVRVPPRGLQRLSPHWPGSRYGTGSRSRLTSRAERDR